MNDAVIRMENIHKAFGETQVLKGVSMSVRRGEIVSIIGPSGSGKSTLLRCINQLEEINLGEIYVNECPMHVKSKSQNEMRKKIGMVFQNFNLFPHYKVIENISKPLNVVKKVDNDEAREIAVEILKKVKLEEKANEYPAQLSGGQKQRVGIARTIAMGSEIILFDEPTSALDPEIAAEVLSTIKSLADEGFTMVIVTHQINFASEISDRIIFIDEGKICEQGAPEEIILSPKNERTKRFLNAIKGIV